MSAWPEAVYVINKINYSLDALFDIDQNGIQNIDALNDRIDLLRQKVGYEEEEGQTVDEDNLLVRQGDIEALLESLNTVLDDIMGDDGVYNDIVQQLNDFEDALSAAEHRIVYIGTDTELNNLSDLPTYAVGLITVEEEEGD